jgi:phage tail-like protein
VLDRAARRLARLRGQPLPARPADEYGPNTFRPCTEAPDPPRLTLVPEPIWPSNETLVGLACSPGGRLAVLSWQPGGAALVRCLEPDGSLGPVVGLRGALFAYSLAWLSDQRLAVLLAGLPTEAPVFEIGPASGEVDPVGDLHPLPAHNGGPFLHSLDLPPRYPTVSDSAPLQQLSLPAYVRAAQAEGATPLDSGQAGTVWHRLYLEASIPARCGIKVYLAASDEPEAPDGPDDWHEHRFGLLFADDTRSGLPRGAWVPTASEVPFHPGLLDAPLEQERAGVFTVLIQRARRRVRTLRGRFLHVRLELLGDGQTTPALAALRAYAPRFSYLERYLPELYRETELGPESDALVPAGTAGGSTAADFLERFVDNFEGVLTTLEDRVASAYLLTDPRTAPEDALEWLGSWIGLSFDPAYPTDRRRALLAAAPDLYRWRGTARGLARALDLATGGAVQGGEVVILEDYRLRRTFSTILGADLADEQDPLTAGLAVSGNSFVGDSLVLGDEQRREFLALFDADLPLTRTEQRAVAGLFDRLAHRVTVLVHQEVQPQDLGLIRRIVALEKPAHVAARVVRASQPFLVGMSALVGVDSYLTREPAPSPVRVGASYVGLRDLVQRPASLDPRLDGGQPNPRLLALALPLADAGPEIRADLGDSFLLDGGRSRPAPGGEIERYRWTQID